MLASRDRSIDMLCGVIILPNMLGISEFGVGWACDGRKQVEDRG
jgi:hypothetical protein